ncbi:uncharacterized protein LOC133206400 [Saccostrea echinata]|uniref:uncharacterized protein LOC133206400 n=1 Tax=Saccostrea echinata TaxID=191078 RepID=UPI002A7F6D54|nr:uncharacterized protein LOC133206400 [Saccostrea echinata]XP_061198347.1 uncharacterized protein LOC133206400 [Saccostrea echinata]
MANTLHLTGNASELDKLIQSFEFENQQYVKLIEAENQQIDALEKDLLDKKDTITRLQEQISSFDEETKRAHKQFTINRENVENLKKTAIVLKEHEEALQKKNVALLELGESESKERSQILEHYKNIWSDYEAKYKSFPLAKALDSLQAENRQLEEQLKQEEDECGKLRERLANLSDSSYSDVGKFNSFAVTIAGIKLETKSVLKEYEKVVLHLSKSQEEKQRHQLTLKHTQTQPMAMTHTTQSNQQQNQSISPQQENAADTYSDSMLISVIREREDDESDVPMQVIDNSQSTQECHSGIKTIPCSSGPSEPSQQHNQEEPMVCSSSGEKTSDEKPSSLLRGQEVMTCTKQVPVVDEQGDNIKTVTCLPSKQPLSQRTSPAVSKLDRRAPLPQNSPMMPKAYLPSLAEMRAKVAIPTPKPSSKLQTESSSKTHQLLIPSISKLSVSQAVTVPLSNSGKKMSNQCSEQIRKPFAKTTTAENLQASFGHQVEAAIQSNIRSSEITNNKMSLKGTKNFTTQSERPKISASCKEQRNPNSTSTKVSHHEVTARETCHREEIEMQEVEPSKTVTTPQTPIVSANTGDVNSASSTPESLQGSTANSGGLSPFDMAKHSERIQMFHKSPGLPPGLYTSKPMLTSSVVTKSNSKIASSETPSFVMQETNVNPFSVNEFNTYDEGRPNHFSGFNELDLGSRGFSFHSNTNDSPESRGFTFDDSTTKSAEPRGFSFGDSFQFGGDSAKGDKCENYLSVFGSETGGSQMESKETSFTFSFSGFQ